MLSILITVNFLGCSKSTPEKESGPQPVPAEDQQETDKQEEGKK